MHTTINVSFQSVGIDVRDSSFKAEFFFKCIYTKAFGHFSFDGYFPTIDHILFLDSDDYLSELGTVDQMEIKAFLEVEMNEKYQSEMYIEWERYNGPDEHGDY